VLHTCASLLPPSSSLERTRHGKPLARNDCITHQSAFAAPNGVRTRSAESPSAQAVDCVDPAVQEEESRMRQIFSVWLASGAADLCSNAAREQPLSDGATSNISRTEPPRQTSSSLSFRGERAAEQPQVDVEISTDPLPTTTIIKGPKGVNDEEESPDSTTVPEGAKGCAECNTQAGSAPSNAAVARSKSDCEGDSIQVFGIMKKFRKFQVIWLAPAPLSQWRLPLASSERIRLQNCAAHKIIPEALRLRHPINNRRCATCGSP